MKHPPQSTVQGWALYEENSGEIFKWSSGPPIFNTRKGASNAAVEFLKTWGRAYYVKAVRIMPR